MNTLDSQTENPDSSSSAGYQRDRHPSRHGTATWEIHGDPAPLFAAISKCQGAVRTAVLDKTNPAFRTNKKDSGKYASLDSCWNAARQAVAENELCVTSLPTTNSDGRLIVVTIIGHSSGSYLEGTLVPPSENRRGLAIQNMGSAISYCRRYVLTGVLGITTGEDDDGEGASGTNRKATQQVPNFALWDQPHHPSWEKESKRFFVLLKEIEIEYRVIKGWCVAKGKPKPSSMDAKKRSKLLEYLRGLDATAIANLIRIGTETATKCES